MAPGLLPLGLTESNLKKALSLFETGKRTHRALKDISSSFRKRPYPSTKTKSGRKRRARKAVKKSGPKKVSNRSVRSSGSSGKNLTLGKLVQKAPKVTPRLSAQVRKIMSSEMPTGVFKNFYFGKLTGWNIANVNKQVTDDRIFNSSDLLALNPAHNMFSLFTPLAVVNAASVLFNNKTNAADWTGTTGNFVFDNLKVFVKYASATVTLRNNTQVPKHIAWYECTPKVSRSVTALVDFQAALAEDDTATLNLSHVGSDDYFVTPSVTKKFATTWKSKVREILLEPGQTHVFTIVGVKNALYDFEKFYSGGTQWLFPKGHGMSCFYIVRNTEHFMDIAAGGAAAFASASTLVSVVGAGAAVTCQLERTFEVQAPPGTAVASQIPGRYIHNLWYAGVAAGTTSWTNPNGTGNESAIRIDVMNPTNLESYAGTHGTGAVPLGS